MENFDPFRHQCSIVTLCVYLYETVVKSHVAGLGHCKHSIQLTRRFPCFLSDVFSWIPTEDFFQSSLKKGWICHPIFALFNFAKNGYSKCHVFAFVLVSPKTRKLKFRVRGQHNWLLVNFFSLSRSSETELRFKKIQVLLIENKTNSTIRSNFFFNIGCLHTIELWMQQNSSSMTCFCIISFCLDFYHKENRIISIKLKWS